MDKFLKSVFQYYKSLIYQNRRWVYVIIFIFGLGVLAGVLISNTAPFITTDVLKQYGSSLNLNLKDLSLSWFILQRNATIVGLATIFGIFLGIIPAATAFLNGLILGLLVGFPNIYKAVNPVQLFLLLFPHGVFEYTATFLALGFGFKFGINWLLPISFGKRFSTLRKNFLEMVQILVLSLVLLTVAALIEGILTGRIACFFSGICR